MKTAFLVSLVLGALPGFGGNQQTSPSGQEPGHSENVAPIALYTHFEQAAPQAIVDALHDELEAIMMPMGFTFEWRSLDGVRGNELSVELAVLTFKGSCDAAHLSPRPVHNPGALGWTHVSDGVILPFSDVDCDRIRGFLQRDLLMVRAPEREAVFGRALARVVAHELYHVLANTVHHGSCGIGKAAYSIQELLSDDFQFEERESLALRTSKVRSALEVAVHGTTSPAPPAPPLP